MISSIQARQEVLNAAREIAASGMVIGTWGNVSARSRDVEGFVITPSGMDYGSMTAEDMVVVDYDRQVLEGSFKPSSETPLHLAIYKARPDVHAIVHVHSPFATAFAVAGRSIPVILEETAQAIGHEIAVVPYALAGSRKLGEYAVQTLGTAGCAALLAHHGVIGCANTVSQALRICYVTEQTAQIALYAHMLGSVPSLPEEEINRLHQGFKNYGQKK